MSVPNNVNNLYSDIFRARESSDRRYFADYPNHDGIMHGVPVNLMHIPDSLPPLVNKSLSNSQDPRTIPRMDSAVDDVSERTIASRSESSAYDHQCRFAFMRSQLSRLLQRSDASDICCLSLSSDPSFSDFLLSLQRLDEESRDRMMNILRLKIGNRNN
jgi:hypothetical protein